LVSGAQLAWVKGQAAANAAPWAGALAAAKQAASTNPTVTPAPHICCGTVSKPNVGCDAEKADASAAYTDALVWALSPAGTADAYGQAAIKILNAYATTNIDHVPSDTTCTDAAGNTGKSFNTRLESGWAGSVFPRAAEIMRSYAGAGTPLDNVAVQMWMRKTYLPNLIAGTPDSPGNWELSVAEALINIGVYLDDNDVFNQGVAIWRRRVPAYIYLKSDGPSGLLPAATMGPLGPIGTASMVCITPDWCPNTPQMWLNPTMYVDGISQETCRDLSHVQFGFASMINGAETARIQGVDLYTDCQDRIVAGLELTASYLNGATMPNPGCTITDPHQGGPLDMSAVGYLARATPPEPTWEIALNHYGAALLPNVVKRVQSIRPTGVDHMMDWETLTHGDVAKSGGPALPPVTVP
jgi:hypothetical protein